MAVLVCSHEKRNTVGVGNEGTQLSKNRSSCIRWE